MFIEAKDLLFEAEESVKTALINQIEAMICGILPLQEDNRSISFYADEVFNYKDWRKVNTQLLNITEVKQNKKAIPFKAIGNTCQELFFKGAMEFDPLLELEVKSGFNKENLPADLRNIMLELIENAFLMKDTTLQEKAYTMGPRKVEYATDTLLKKMTSNNEILQKKVWDILARYSW